MNEVCVFCCDLPSYSKSCVRGELRKKQAWVKKETAGFFQGECITDPKDQFMRTWHSPICTELFLPIL